MTKSNMTVKEKHTHRFVKYSEKVEDVNLGKGLFVTIYKCKCGKTQTFIDTPDGSWSKTLPDSFVLPIHGGQHVSR